MQAHTAIARFLEILNPVGRLLPIDNCDPPVSLKSRAIQPFDFHEPSEVLLISAARERPLLVPLGAHKSIIATAEFALHDGQPA